MSGNSIENDRYRLVLLQKAKQLDRKQQREVKCLSKAYLNNKEYEGKIIENLIKSGLLHWKDADHIKNENGDWIKVDTNTVEHLETTDKGIEALRFTFRPSEHRKKARNKMWSYITGASIIIIIVLNATRIFDFFKSIFN